jgi:ligand-binding SRPBCC domain-containing protein
MSRTYRIKSVQVLPVTLEQAWKFFSDPDNLQHITPKDMGFTVKSEAHGDRIYPGQVIEYSLKPMLGIKVYWMTEITHVEEKRFFVDEQRFGPYSLWHHQHHFKEVPGGVEMTDIIHYRIPLGWLGDLANRLFVRRKLDKLFAYRTDVISPMLILGVQ